MIVVLFGVVGCVVDFFVVEVPCDLGHVSGWFLSCILLNVEGFYVSK